MATRPALAPALEQARALHRAGRSGEALALLGPAIGPDCADPAALNQLGLLLLAAGRFAEAAGAFARAAAVDPAALGLWLNLADAHRRAGDRHAEIAALDRSLSIDPYLFAALLAKGAALEAIGEADAAITAYRGLLKAYPDAAALTPEVGAALGQVRAKVDAAGQRRRAELAQRTDALLENADASEARRARAYLDQLAGLRKVYAPDPVAGHFPFLPAYEFFDEALFPWLHELEAATDMVRRELIALWHDGQDAPEPYVAFPAGVPVNQWADLNHSPKWSAFFLWRDGVAQDANLARCPETAALLQRLPILDLPGKGPTAMFSILEPHTRIPPHTGSTNIRGTVHLPLVLPPECRFRVGGETREWQMGRAWVFDDTIEHEAWNDSDQPRAILIFDCWNPYLSEAERTFVRAAGG